MADEAQTEAATEQAEKHGAKLVTVVFSAGRAAYHVAEDREAKQCWLSVERYPLPCPQAHPGMRPNLGGALTADGQGWRKVYDVAWTMLAAKETVVLPADDLLVVDYRAAEIFVAEVTE
jgi:hypothetical protein